MTTTQTPAAQYETYSWLGTNRRGEARTGRVLMSAADLAPLVEDRYRKGWRSLRVARGESLPVANSADVAAAIEPHPDTGRRMWWSEDTESAVRAHQDND